MGCINTRTKGNIRIYERNYHRNSTYEREKLRLRDKIIEEEIDNENNKNNNDNNNNNNNNNQYKNINKNEEENNKLIDKNKNKEKIIITQVNKNNEQNLENNNENKTPKLLKVKKELKVNEEENINENKIIFKSRKKINENENEKENKEIKENSTSNKKLKSKKRRNSCKEFQNLSINENKPKSQRRKSNRENEKINLKLYNFNNEEEEENSSRNENEIINQNKKKQKKKVNFQINDLIKKDKLWKESKKQLFSKFKESIEETEIFDILDFSITSIISISKNDFSKYNILQKYIIHEIKKSNNINWVRKPYNSLKKKLAQISLINPLLEEYINFDFNNNSLNEYESFNSEIKMLKLTSIDEKQNLEHFIFSPEKINENILILIFDFEDLNSMILFKEIEEYKKKKKNSKNHFIFFPIYAPILESAMTTSYVYNSIKNNGINDDNLNIYFMEKDDLNKRFNYISNDNKKKIICKVILIDEDKIIRHILSPKNFSFNLITQINQIDKNDYQVFKNNLNEFIYEQNNNLNELQNNPIYCNLFLKKTNIYSYSKSKKKIILIKSFYESLYGEIKNYNNIESFYDELKEKFKYEKRENPKQLRISHEKKTELISNLLNDLFQKNKLKNVNFITKFGINKLYMEINPNDNYEQKFNMLKNKNFKIEILLTYHNFIKKKHFSLSSGASDLIQFSFIPNLDYLSCVLNLNEVFPKQLKLFEPKTKEQIELNLNEEDNDNVTLIIVFSLSSADYFAKMEMIYRLNIIYKKIESLRDTLNIYLIYRGELINFDKEFNEIKDEEIFNQNFPLFICTINNLIPLFYYNNGIETSDSQFKVFLLDKFNRVSYQGMCDDINLKISILNISNEDKIKYLKHYPISKDIFKNEIEPIVSNLEKKLKEILTKNPNEKLLYRPYISFSYCKFDSYKNNKCDNNEIINTLRLKLLIKEKHKNIILKNPEIKESIKKLKEYGTSILIVPLPCEELELNYICNICNKKINKNNPFYYNQEEEISYCINCEKKAKIKSVYLIYIKSENLNNEIISDLFVSTSTIHSEINPLLGSICKICNCNLEKEFYLNLTHINILSQISQMLPIDICQNCFNIIEEGGNFNDYNCLDNYNKFGLSSEHMIYRRIKYQQQNSNLMFQFEPIDYNI